MSATYDPKEVAALAPEALDAAVREAEKAFADTSDLDALAVARPEAPASWSGCPPAGRPTRADRRRWPPRRVTRSGSGAQHP